MTGNLQLLRALPAVLSPRQNPLLARYVSHKLLRVLSPLLIMVLIGAGVTQQSFPYGFFALVVAAFLGAGLIGVLVPIRTLALPAAFAVVQWAALMSLLRPAADARSVWATGSASAQLGGHTVASSSSRDR
jgi:hypothetical protein